MALLTELDGVEDAAFAGAITRDLDRTSDQPLFADAQSLGQRVLLRVLRAYSAFDPEVGYCQGMNWVVATLIVAVVSADVVAVESRPSRGGNPEPSGDRGQDPERLLAARVLGMLAALMLRPCYDMRGVFGHGMPKLELQVRRRVCSFSSLLLLVALILPIVRVPWIVFDRSPPLSLVLWLPSRRRGGAALHLRPTDRRAPAAAGRPPGARAHKGQSSASASCSPPSVVSRTRGLWPHDVEIRTRRRCHDGTGAPLATRSSARRRSTFHLSTLR